MGHTFLGFTDSINKRIASGLISFTEFSVHLVRRRPPVQSGAAAPGFLIGFGTLIAALGDIDQRA